MSTKESNDKKLKKETFEYYNFSKSDNDEYSMIMEEDDTFHAFYKYVNGGVDKLSYNCHYEGKMKNWDKKAGTAVLILEKSKQSIFVNKEDKSRVNFKESTIKCSMSETGFTWCFGGETTSTIVIPRIRDSRDKHPHGIYYAKVSDIVMKETSEEDVVKETYKYYNYSPSDKDEYSMTVKEDNTFYAFYKYVEGKWSYNCHCHGKVKSWDKKKGKATLILEKSKESVFEECVDKSQSSDKERILKPSMDAKSFGWCFAEGGSLLVPRI